MSDNLAKAVHKQISISDAKLYLPNIFIRIQFADGGLIICVRNSDKCLKRGCVVFLTKRRAMANSITPWAQGLLDQALHLFPIDMKFNISSLIDLLKFLRL